jgi:hypothetical protein
MGTAYGQSSNRDNQKELAEMKLPEFPALNKCEWDFYRRFHSLVHGPFVQFDSGELIITHANPRDRGEYRELGLSIHLAKDPRCPRLTSPVTGKAVAKTWFPRGVTLLLDHDLGRATLVRRLYAHTGDDEAAPIPAWLDGGCFAYFPGGGLPAVGGTICYDEPRKIDWPTEAHAREIHTLCAAWFATRANKMFPALCAAWFATRANKMFPATWVIECDAPRIDILQLASLSFVDLSDAERWTIARHGVARPVDKREVTHLLY